MNYIDLVNRGIAKGWLKMPEPSSIEPNHKLTPAQVKELLAMRAAGDPLKVIASHFKIHHQTVSAICDFHKVKP